MHMDHEDPNVNISLEGLAVGEGNQTQEERRSPTNDTSNVVAERFHHATISPPPTPSSASSSKPSESQPLTKKTGDRPTRGLGRIPTSISQNNIKTSEKDCISLAHSLPPEILSLIFTRTGDWELCTLLRVPSHLSITTPWLEQATLLDHAILDSLDDLTPILQTRQSGHRRFTQWGGRVMIRFSMLRVIEYFWREDPKQFMDVAKNLLPIVASAWGRVDVLEWAYGNGNGKSDVCSRTSKDEDEGGSHDGCDLNPGQNVHSRSSQNQSAKVKGKAMNIPEQTASAKTALRPDKQTINEAIDEASRHGHVNVLEFWASSGLPLSYTEHALQNATFQRQLAVLEWWKQSNLPLKIGNVLDFASMEGSTICLDWWAASGLPCRYSRAALNQLSKHGNVPLLRWWKNSRFPLDYDKTVLQVATIHGQLEVLDWWFFESDAEVEYRFFDIEEALEDSVVDAEAGRATTPSGSVGVQGVSDGGDRRSLTPAPDSRSNGEKTWGEGTPDEEQVEKETNNGKSATGGPVSMKDHHAALQRHAAAAAAAAVRMSHSQEARPSTSTGAYFGNYTEGGRSSSSLSPNRASSPSSLAPGYTHHHYSRPHFLSGIHHHSSTSVSSLALAPVVGASQQEVIEKWWEDHTGYNVHMSTAEWTKPRNLKLQRLEWEAAQRMTMRMIGSKGGHGFAHGDGRHEHMSEKGNGFGSVSVRCRLPM